MHSANHRRFVSAESSGGHGSHSTVIRVEPQNGHGSGLTAALGLIATGRLRLSGMAAAAGSLRLCISRTASGAPAIAPA